MQTDGCQLFNLFTFFSFINCWKSGWFQVEHFARYCQLRTASEYSGKKTTKNDKLLRHGQTDIHREKSPSTWIFRKFLWTLVRRKDTWGLSHSPVLIVPRVGLGRVREYYQKLRLQPSHPPQTVLRRAREHSVVDPNRKPNKVHTKKQNNWSSNGTLSKQCKRSKTETNDLEPASPSWTKKRRKPKRNLESSGCLFPSVVCWIVSFVSAPIICGQSHK